MSLNNSQIKTAKPKPKPYRLFDRDGLYLEISPRGGKWWRHKYRFEGKEKRISYGVYPDVSLSLARDRCQESRRLLASQIDPSENRKALKKSNQEKLAHTFEIVSREWFLKFSKTWTETYGLRVIKRLENHLFPFLGKKPIVDITTPELLKVLIQIESRGTIETAHRVLQFCSQIYRYAISTGRVDRDITVDLKGALQPYTKKHLAAVTSPEEVGELLKAIEAYEGFFPTQCALKLAPLVFVRPGELRQAQWSEFNLEKREWNIPAEKMKMREPHLVPLSRQAVKILEDLKPYTHRSPYLFPSLRSLHRPMSNNALLVALRSMGYTKEQMTVHGFRALARTLLDEVLGYRPDIIEHQLAHTVKDPNGRAYNRTKHLSVRKKMMQEWGDYLEGLKS